MALRTDRLSTLIEGSSRKRLVLTTPEGIPLEVQIASRAERLSAFMLDILFMSLAVLVLTILLLLLFFGHSKASVAKTLILFLIFLVTNLYFIHFELAWQGRTPGKNICKLRVVNRAGGQLTPMAVIARNLTREVEFFLPVKMFFFFVVVTDWQNLVLLAWFLTFAAVPFFNRQNLRAGDLIGGTLVIAMPQRVLLKDMAAPTVTEAERRYKFTHAQLSVYGAFELQVLEEFLRRPDTPDTVAALREVCEKIRAKIGWQDAVEPAEVRRFLTEFYTAERADLERGQLYGKLREDKTQATGK